MTMFVVNAETLAVSEYTGLNHLALADLDGSLYSVLETKLVEFTGTTDDTVSIEGYMQTGKVGISDLEETRYTRAYVKDRFANALTLSTIVDIVDSGEVASEETHTYSIHGGSGAVQHTQAVRLRSDLKGTGWAWKLANVSGGGMMPRAFVVVSEEIEIDV